MRLVRHQRNTDRQLFDRRRHFRGRIVLSLIARIIRDFLRGTVDLIGRPGQVLRRTLNVGKLAKAAQQRIIGMQRTTDFIVRAHAYGLGEIELSRRAGNRLLHCRQRPRNRAPKQPSAYSDHRQPGERDQCRHQQRRCRVASPVAASSLTSPM